jgi:fermentation-respiration switch protein FrsA (DUF1100 family)
MGVGIVTALWAGASLAVVTLAMRRGRDRFEEWLPERLVGRAESVRISTRDGEELGAWFLDAERDDAASVLLLHGRGGTRASRLDAAQIFEGAGSATLLLTLRAHGDSTGERNDFGWSARADVIAAVAWLETRRPDAPIVVCGVSLGAAAAAFAAGELGLHVDGYILECLYRDLDTAARNRTAISLPPVLDWIAYAGMRAASEVLMPNWREIAPIEAITRIPHDVPVLLLAGALDTRVTAANTRDLYERIADHAELVTLEGAGHDRLPFASPEQYARAVTVFVRDVEQRAAEK